MKNILVLLIILLVFVACATLGFTLMSRVDQERAAGQTAALSTVTPGNQHYFVLIQVDELTAPSPRLAGAWFVSLFATEGHPPTLTFTQVYPSQSHPERDQALERAFALDSQRNPSAGFWNEMQTFQIASEGYLLVDNQGLEHVFGWLGETQGLDPVSMDILMQSQDRARRMQAGCQAVALQSTQPDRPFTWDDLLPDHFQSNLRMEMALAYWQNAMNSGDTIRCEVFQAP